MAAFTTMALVGAAVLSGAGTAIQQRRARKDQEKAMREQEEAARIAAANSAAIQKPTDELTADVTLGRGKSAQPTGALASTGGVAAQTGSVSARVGGLKKRASSGLGL